MIKIRPILALAKESKTKEAIEALSPSAAGIKSFIAGYIKEPYELNTVFGVAEPQPPKDPTKPEPVRYGVVAAVVVRGGERDVATIGTNVTVIEGETTKVKIGSRIQYLVEGVKLPVNKEFFERLTEYCQGEWSLFGQDVVVAGKEKANGKR